MNNVEIRKVNNGYVVLPSWSSNNAHQVINGKEVNVFETFEALTEFLKNNFEESGAV